MNPSPPESGGGGSSSGAGNSSTSNADGHTHSPSLAHLNLSPTTPVPPSPPSATPPIPKQPSEGDSVTSASSELNYLLTESGLYPSMDGKKKKMSGASGKKPPYPTGSAVNTTTPGPHRRPNPNHPANQHLFNHHSSSASSSSHHTHTTPLGASNHQNTTPLPTAASLTPAQYEMIAPTWRYDPLASPDWDSAGPPGALCARRVKKDLSTIFTEPLPGIFAVPQEDNLFLVHCLIVGPFDTPYEGGFFHFVVRFGPSYPIHPPRVRLLTTGAGSVRFNPNLYKNGKVCLSILGTWPGPAWSPAANLSSVLLSLQSLMNEKPYHNEPGYDTERNPGDSTRYNTIITHETLRVSVVQQLETLTTESPSAVTTTTASAAAARVPPELRKVMESSFLEYYDHYVEVCMNNMQQDMQLMEDPFGEIRGRFTYSQILKGLRKLKARLKTTIAPTPKAETSPATSESDDDYYAEEDEEEEEEEEEDSGGGAVVSGAVSGSGEVSGASTMQEE